MGKKELIERLSKNFEMSKAETESIFNEMFGTIEEILQEGNEVSIPRFGKFIVYQSKSRQGRNPATGESVNIPEKTRVKFKPSDKLKQNLQ